MFGIYKVTNRVNGKIYIAKSRNLDEIIEGRKTGYFDIKKLPMREDLALYGIEKFDFDILEECSESQLAEKERYYISVYGLKKKKSKSLESSLIDSIPSVGKNNSRKNNPNIGIGLKRHVQKMRTDAEYRAQMVEKYKNNRPNSISVDMVDSKTGEIMMSFPKIMEGAKWIRENTKYIKADYATINKVCKGKGKTAYGYKWQYTRDRLVNV